MLSDSHWSKSQTSEIQPFLEGLTAIEHPEVEDLVVKASSSGNAVMFTPKPTRASVMSKSAGSKEASSVQTDVTSPRPRAALDKEKRILTE